MILTSTTKMKCPRQNSKGDELCSFQGPVKVFVGAGKESHQCPSCGFTSDSSSPTRLQFTPVR